MHRTVFQARVFVALIISLLLPAAMVRAQATPEGTPAPGGPCIDTETDPTEGNDISFERLSGPLDDSQTGPSLYRVYFDVGNNNGPAIFFHGCEAEPLAVYVSSGTVFLRAFVGTTHIFVNTENDQIPEGITCERIDPKPEHEERTSCTLAADGSIATLNAGDGAFHEGGASFAYASTAEELGSLSRSGLTNARMAGGASGPENGSARHQPSDQSVDVASGNKKPSGCGGECL